MIQYTIWCNASLVGPARDELIAGCSEHRLLWDDGGGTNLDSGSPSTSLPEADIAFGQPDPRQVIELPNLRWTHLTSAGYTRYDRPELRAAFKARGALLTNSSSVYDEPCAQHLLAFMLAQARQLPQAMAAQVRGEAWVYEGLRPATRVLSDQTVLILGYGAIARRLAELLKPFRLRVVAVRRDVHGDEPIELHPIDQIDQLLPDADHVANALPDNPSTRHLMNAARFGLMKAGAEFYNIGRGSTVDQEALLEALRSGRLAAASLDVTDPEPLPASHPLWSQPNCFITPHIAGGMADEASALVRHFLANLANFVADRPLLDRVV
jgi:phosphoglycerate dehydrogenase-like enzyme